MAAAAAVILLLLLGVAYSHFRSKPRVVRIIGRESTASSAVDSRVQAGRAQLSIHVAGAVNKPGLYEVGEGSRVADAVSRAGGPAPDALLDNLNLAARLKDGEKVMVPRGTQQAAGQQDVSAEAATGSGSSGSAVNINIASVDELDRLPGVGPALSQRIVEYRQKNGAFSSVEELDNVEGIGPSKMESLKDLVTI